MLKFVSGIIGFAFLLGMGDSLVRATYDLSKSAHHAQVFDQISYVDFTQALIKAKPKKIHR